ncbi:MAG: HU family DNA-binding protein [Desulfobacterales bacterium]|nr:HU family DNA-binding protein [Desulfobacterales bacterium]
MSGVGDVNHWASQTGEPIKIKATNTVKFKAGKKLKDAV